MPALSRKVLLVKPSDNYFFPIGYAYVATALKSAGIEFDYIDLHLHPTFDLEAHLRTHDYLAVCAGGLLWSLPHFKEIFATAKRVNPRLACILGGNIVVDFSSQILFEYLDIDYLVIGEGEITATLLLQHIDVHGISPTSLEGVAYRTLQAPGSHVRNARRPFLDLTSRNWMPTWDFVEVDRYSYSQKLQKRFFPVLTGRGCTGRCAFCSPTNGRYRGRPVEHVLAELEYLISHYDFDYFYFINEVFFQTEEQIIAFCRGYSRLKGRKPWMCPQRMDTPLSVLAFMKEAGCFTVTVGLESGSDAILKKMKKNITTDQARAYIAALKEQEIQVEASFIFGNFEETPEDMAKTVDLMLDLDAFGPMVLCITYPGTLNYQRARRLGLVRDDLQYILDPHDAYNPSYLRQMEDHYSGKRRYLNITAMDDDLLFATVVHEMRRLYSQGYCYRQVTASTQDGIVYQLRGTCPICRGIVEKKASIDDPSAFQEHLCPECGEPHVHFPARIIPVLRQAQEAALVELESAGSIAVVGTADQVRAFLKLGVEGFPYDKVAGFLRSADSDPLHEGSWIGNLRQLSPEEVAHSADTLVALGAAAGDALSNLISRGGAGFRALGALHEAGRLGVRSVFPYGRLGVECCLESLAGAHVLVACCARQEPVRELLRSLRARGCTVSVLILQDSPSLIEVEDLVNGSTITCPGSLFNAQTLPEAALTSDADCAVVPFIKELTGYGNVLACLAACGIPEAYAWHVNNSQVPDEERRRLVSMPYPPSMPLVPRPS